MPKEGSHAILSFTNACLMYLIMHCIPVNFTYHMITHLCYFASCNAFVLLYEMFLTHVFYHFGISFDSESIAPPLLPVYTYTFDSPYHMHYT